VTKLQKKNRSTYARASYNKKVSSGRKISSKQIPVFQINTKRYKQKEEGHKQKNIKNILPVQK